MVNSPGIGFRKGTSTSSVPFTSSWKTDNAGTSSSVQITVPTVSTGTYNCTVVWGDGNSSAITTYNDAAWTHTYSGAGTYTVTITGTFIGIKFNNGGDKLKLLNISFWGTNFKVGTTEGSYFRGCANLTITATDILNLSGTTSLSNLFDTCTSVTNIPNINSWDTSSVTNMNAMFRSVAFNQALVFNTSSVTNMSTMFSGCSVFNSSITFTTSAVTDMSSMFLNCSVFNQAVNFNTAAVTSMSSMFNGCAAFNQSISAFNTTAVTNMNSMFNGCSAFNQSVSTFTTAAVTNMASMFKSASVFDQDVSTWSIAALTSAGTMFTSSGFTITNYNLLLDSTTGWPSQGTIQSSVTFSAGTAHYSGANAVAGRAVLTTTKSWTISDGGTP